MAKKNHLLILGGTAFLGRALVEEARDRDRDLDVLRVGSDRGAMETALVTFMAERRLRHVS